MSLSLSSLCYWCLCEDSLVSQSKGRGTFPCKKSESVRTYPSVPRAAQTPQRQGSWSCNLALVRAGSPL